MLKIKFFVITVLIMLISACSCNKVTPNIALKAVTADQVAAAIAVPSADTLVLDVNPESVRDKKGVIPNAIRLSSYNNYAMSELPTDKSTALIFYCYNEACGASTQAANRALDNGYANVSILKVGIIGWNAQLKKSD
jgi:rhodanese-related sulfurtransferase